MDTCAEQPVLKAAELAKLASTSLAGLSSQQKNNALLAIAEALESNADAIAAENQKDMEAARIRVEKGELNESLYQRLKLDKAKLLGVIAGIKQIASMPEPIGIATLARELDADLNLYRLSCPIGVVAIIFESRPEAMPQILSLCLKTSNAVVLKGGAEAEKSNRILFDTMQNAAANSGLPKEAFALIETRADVKQLLNAEGFVDLIIPRGSNDLVRFIQNNTRIPVLGHADGICHIYVDKTANFEKAISVITDAKIQYPSACNAVETVLIHSDVLSDILPALCKTLHSHNVELRLDPSCHSLLEKTAKKHGIQLSELKQATEDDWSTEYCDLILAIRSVESLQDAIEHINKYGSGHTEAMIAEDRKSFQDFFSQVNSAGVYLNASTRFADGFRYGFGAEVGISTAKMHPRGPVGIEGLVSYKYQLLGDGHIVADYTGAKAKQFTHRNIPSG